MYVEIARSTVTGFQVRVMDPAGRMTRMFTYPTIDHARRAASEMGKRLQLRDCR
jgi:hypothetical protein